ncbi:uncharacterized protein cubi_02750 [Cryptosporidium ubiquitum]|uniref:Uncharacterized protein n=1 Tax=Cryptosporidium ubiquitum TaxID=857276 RepID=A0A1J4MLQ8_9CRYT|nr:uncharacterized protein cubi_02750 [Cryptosporidium ubiquitum]OII73948.1 hypothetical protein cubi_02750 [Cryptosporidium ubiquitum]
MNLWVLVIIFTDVVLLVVKSFSVAAFGGARLFPYRNPQVGVIPVSVGSGHGNYVVRIWEESVTSDWKRAREERRECLVMGRGISCGDSDCKKYMKSEKGVAKVCNYNEFRPENRWIPSFIDVDLPICKVFNLRNAEGIENTLTESLFNSPRACLCFGEEKSENYKILSPPISGDKSGGWRFELFQDEMEVPKIYPFSRFIVDVRVLVNPGWNFEFVLSSSSLHINKAAFSIVSLKKDYLCQGFPEDESLQILQPTSLASKGSQLIQTYSWNPRKLNTNIKDNLFDYKFPVNQLTTTHYYICHYYHYNSNSGNLLGSVYFRLNPEDATQTFSLLLLIIIFTPLVLFSIYIIISSKYKTNIEKLQGYILFEDRNQVSSLFF